MSFVILIVEDDPRSRKLLVDLLTVKGYCVIEAHNGQEGIRQARTSQPNLILLDIQMPLMDGFEAVRSLKADTKTQKIPVWALTSYALRTDAEKILAEGCEICLTKPYDVPSLLLQIEALAKTSPSLTRNTDEPGLKGAL